ncbi:regulation of nuclear pre-mRNA domain-containing protein 1B-like [Impatiens glandulifera]|uniref:regulation of nuclear pre-mRNA domain-containing protein 1B-like n=1 Tax=Impatiens glandulifera TaxID=253017 RepID=UPI001FB0B211|nr:regulation of nuclear pre-mRNA domain-containing protein 1B-like [Impatiens glandulifera]
MSDGIFDAQILSEKLSKLNSSQQSIESVSSWCITYRKKAKEIVEIWDSSFNSAKKERVAFLYLANDILQNSRRKGSEYVNEFWKVLPGALNNVFQSADDHGKKAATRLMDIWEDRKVFGSRAQNLKDELLDKDPLAKINNGKSSNPIKTVKREGHSLRFKLPVGGTPEKIVTAFQSIHDDAEEDALENCKAAVSCLEKIEILEGFASAEDQMYAQENILQECMKQLHSAEANRSSLVSILKAVLTEQESKVETIQSHLQVAQGLIEQMNHTRKRHSSLTTTTTTPLSTVLETATSSIIESKIPSLKTTNSSPSLEQKTSEDENNNKSAAAMLAAKLTASTSSMQMLSSVLSSLAADGASMTRLMTSSSSSSPPFISPPPEKRSKLETTTTFVPPMMPYQFNNGLPPPPHHLPPHIPMGMARPGPPAQPATNNTGGGYYHHHHQAGVGMYGQSHQPPSSSSTPQVNRQ